MKLLKSYIRNILLEDYSRANPMSIMYLEIGEFVYLKKIGKFGKVLEPTQIEEEKIYPSKKFAGYFNRDEVITSDEELFSRIRDEYADDAEGIIQDLKGDGADIKNIVSYRSKIDLSPMFPYFDIQIWDEDKKELSNEIVTITNWDKVVSLIKDARYNYFGYIPFNKLMVAKELLELGVS